MSTSTISNHTLTPVEISTLQSPAHMCWIVLGLMAAICNLLILLTIAKTESLHTKSQFLVVSLAFVDMCRSLSYFGTGLKRYLIYVRQSPEIIQPLFCVLQSSPLLLFAAVSANLKFALSIDRLLAMAAPIFYRSRSTKPYIALVNGVVWSHGVLHASLAFFGYNHNLTLSICTALSSFNGWYKSYTSLISLLITGVTTGIYIVSLLFLRRRVMSLKGMNETQRREERVRLELGVFRSLMAILFGYMATTVVGAMAYFIIPYLSGQIAVLLAPFLALFFVCDCALHLIIFMCLNGTFRRALLSLVTSTSTAVQHIGPID